MSERENISKKEIPRPPKMRRWQVLLCLLIEILVLVGSGISIGYFIFKERLKVHEVSTECLIIGCSILNNYTCDGILCSTYNFNYTAVVNGITYQGNIIDGTSTGWCENVPYTKRCYYQDDQIPPTFSLRAMSDSLSIILLVISSVFLVAFSTAMYLIYHYHIRRNYVEIKN